MLGILNSFLNFLECYNGQGRNYRGKIATSSGGKKCTKWATSRGWNPRR